MNQITFEKDELEEIKNILEIYVKQTPNFKLPFNSLDYLEIAKQHLSITLPFLNFVFIKSTDEKLKNKIQLIIENNQLIQLPNLINKIKNNLYSSYIAKSELNKIINDNYFILTFLPTLIISLMPEKKSIFEELEKENKFDK